MRIMELMRIITNLKGFNFINYVMMFGGECCRPWSKGEKPREQEARLAELNEGNSAPPCNDLPDIQDPTVSIRPLALPPLFHQYHIYIKLTRAFSVLRE